MQKISICIPTYNRQKSLINLLRTLQNQIYNNFEICIIEGGNVELTKKVIAPFYNKLEIIIDKQQKEGLVNARNEAWRRSTGDVIILIDDDVIIPKSDWIVNIITTYNRDTRIGAVGGPSLLKVVNTRDLVKYVINDTNMLTRFIKYVYFNIFLEGKPFMINKFFKSGAFSLGSSFTSSITNIPEIIDVDYLDASNMSFRRDILELTDGFDPIYRGVGDYSEPDLCFRIKKLGFRIVFNKNAIVHHYPSLEGVFTLRSNSYDRGFNFMTFIKRWIGFNKKSLLYSMFISYYYILKAFETRDLNWIKGIKGMLDAIK